MHSVDWDGLQVFLAIARAGRISAAARRLGVEHTTVARRLALLEHELGVPLFYRTTTGYLLTAHGQNVVANAEAMEHAAVAVAARAREGSAGAAGPVRVALPPEFASHWLSPNLPAFRSRHPRVELNVLVGTRQRNLARGEAELAVQSPRPRAQGLVAVRIARTRTALYASTDVAARRRLRVTDRRTLNDLPLLVYTSPFDMLQEAKWFQPLLDSDAVALRTNSTHALVAAAQAGTGIAVIPRFVARQHQDLVAVSETVAEHDVWMITHPDFKRDPKVRATADFLKAAAAGPLGLE